MAKQHPGSERARDENRAGGPRYHGAQWVKAEDEPREAEAEAEAEVAEAIPEVVGSGEHEGMGRVAGHGHKDEDREPPPGDLSREKHEDHRPPKRHKAASARAQTTSAARIRGRKTPERR